jgi:pimeloyl-ACP methyl ester carboxylesterase
MLSLSNLFSITTTALHALWWLTCFTWKKIPDQPKSWMYSTAGSMFAMAIMKLSPIHRQLIKQEANNFTDYMNSDWVPPHKRRRIPQWWALCMAYGVALLRMFTLSPKNRQDYYALNRRGAFVAKSVPTILKSVEQTSFSAEVPPLEIPSLEAAKPVVPTTQNTNVLPILIVPGLNTPPVFFRAMVDYFSQLGYPVYVATLPKQGLSEVAEAAEAVYSQMVSIMQQHNVAQVNIIGHSLGGIITQHLINTLQNAGKNPPIKTLIALGSGFFGADGVEILKNGWIPKNAGKPIPKVFDELIRWNGNLMKQGVGVVYHSIVTTWDFLVPFRKAFFKPQLPNGLVFNHLLDDWAIDHVTIALHPKALQTIHQCLLQTVTISAL